MKRFVMYITGLLLLLMTPNFVMAGGGEGVFYPGNNNEIVAYQVTVSADAAAVNLPVGFIGAYLYPVEIKSSVDDAVAVTVNTGQGTALGTKTTSSATTGEWLTPAVWYPVTTRPTYTVSGLGSGTLTLIFAGVKVTR